jgi:hypothetical protein
MIQLNRLQSIIPVDQAIGNKGFATALQQITGIMYLTLPEFAVTVIGIENTRDLSIIQSQTQAVPSSVADYYINNYGIVTNPIPTLKIVDVLGTPSGWVHTDALNDTTAQIATMNTSYLQSIYQTMLNVVNGVYDIVVPPVPPDPDPTTAVEIPPGTPGAGTYATKDEAILALIALAQSEITTLQSTYPTQTTAMNTDFTNMANQLVQEQTQQTRANLNFTELLANDKNSMFGFVFALPDYGLDIVEGGMSYYITNLSDLSGQTGQAVVGCLREGRDRAELNLVGIGTNSNIPI